MKILTDTELKFIIEYYTRLMTAEKSVYAISEWSYYIRLYKMYHTCPWYNYE